MGTELVEISVPPIHDKIAVNWNQRYASDDLIEPRRKYIFVCEGANTETFYFTKLGKLRVELGFNSLVCLYLLKRDGIDRTNSYPMKLIEYADSYGQANSFDAEYDRIVIVFDADIFEYKSSRYNEIVNLANERRYMLGITNPCFEIFLLLHFENAYKRLIEPVEQDLLLKENLGKHGLAYRLLQGQTQINSKRNEDIGLLANYVKLAIAEERHLNQNIYECKGRVTSNIGQIIQSILLDG